MRLQRRFLVVKLMKERLGRAAYGAHPEVELASSSGETQNQDYVAAPVSPRRQQMRGTGYVLRRGNLEAWYLHRGLACYVTKKYF